VTQLEQYGASADRAQSHYTAFRCLRHRPPGIYVSCPVQRTVLFTVLQKINHILPLIQLTRNRF